MTTVNTAELAAMREDMDSLMVDTGEVFTRDLGALNPTTGEYDSPVDTVIWSGPCSIAPLVFLRSRQEEVGELAGRVRSYRVLLPHDADAAIELHQLFRVTASTDPVLTSREFDIVDVMYTTDEVARRITVQDTNP